MAATERREQALRARLCLGLLREKEEVTGRPEGLAHPLC
jgi:hypothetical protein